MVVLRLRRGGRKHSPHYRIVAQEKRSKLNGAYIESLGHYHPANKEKQLVVNADKIKLWIEHGASLSTTVNNLLVREGVLPKKNKVSRVYSNKKHIAKQASKEEKTPKESPAVEDVVEDVVEVVKEDEVQDKKQESSNQ